MHTDKLAIRWNLGDVSRRGFEALQFSLWGARHLFGAEPTYVVCVNSISVDDAKTRTGPVPTDVQWRAASRDDMPEAVRQHLGRGLSEQAGWRFSPLRLVPGHRELVLDNTCILWEVPAALRTWLDGAHDDHTLLPETRRDGSASASQPSGGFVPGGILGLSRPDEYEQAVLRALNTVDKVPGRQGESDWQMLALSEAGRVLRISAGELRVCTPLLPESVELGTCGAHFIDLNPGDLPGTCEGRPAAECVAEQWDRLMPEIAQRTRVKRDTHARDLGWMETLGPTERARSISSENGGRGSLFGLSQGD